MSQAERPKFKSTIIDAEWTRAPSAVPPSTPPVSQPPVQAAQQPAAPESDAPRRSEPRLAVWSRTNPGEAVVARGWSSPSVVLQEIDLPEAVDRRLVMLWDPMSEQARAYRLLQHWLLAHADPRVIAVTSARPGEGKTTCATNLALAFADETRARVLLIDANLRRPAMSQLFRFEPEESFIGRMVEYRDATPPYSVAGIRGTRLQVAALPPKVGAGQRLDRVLFGNAIRRLRGAFDYIVIDTASVLESADADVVSEASDGVIVTMRAKKSERSSVKSAVQKLSPATVLGTVLIDA